VVVFDGDYVCGSLGSASDALVVAIRCLGTARWLDLGVDAAHDVLAAVNENRSRLGLDEL
jgi:hypothetical protein